jgi:hypothetical protein
VSIVILALYLTGRKALALKLLKESAEFAEWFYFESGLSGLKLLKALNIYDELVGKLPKSLQKIIKTIPKEKLIQLLESKIVPQINSEVKPKVKEVMSKAVTEATTKAIDRVVEHITLTPEPTSNEVVVALADKIKTDENTKAMYSIYGKVVKDHDEPKPDWEVGATIVGKLGK